MDFNEKCYRLLGRVPKGNVTTYRAIANALGSRGYRAVGNAMNKNKNVGVVPCHRVVCSDGGLGRYSKGIQKKIQLLKSEGIEIKNNKIDLKEFGYFFN